MDTDGHGRRYASCSHERERVDRTRMSTRSRSWLRRMARQVHKPSLPSAPGGGQRGSAAGHSLRRAFVLGFTLAATAGALEPPRNLHTLSRHLRVDIAWDGPCTEAEKVEIQRSPDGRGEGKSIFADVCKVPFHCDFLGKPGQTRYYRARRVRRKVNWGRSDRSDASDWSDWVRGKSRASTDGQLMTELQEVGLRYFLDFAHPVSGMARERSYALPDQCAIGATGMAFFNLVVGIERQLVGRDRAALHILKVLRFLADKADRFHGVWPHWVNGSTGEVHPFSRYDDGADLVETAFLAQGLVLLREYFDRDTPRDAEIRRLADVLWRGIEWNWFVKEWRGRTVLMWHWSPRHGWKQNVPVRGFNEAQIVYILALASPTHPAPLKCYETGWHHDRYSQKRQVFGITLELSHGVGIPLFFTQYSYLGLDPKRLSYNGRTYHEHFRDLSLAQVRYARARQPELSGYGSLWGFTSSMDPEGYSNHRPGTPNENGTIAPTAALSAMPYVPAESLACLREMYERHGAKTWDAFGFRDAFNPSKDWVAQGLLGIDAGPIGPMIENHRSGLCWNTFMKAPEIRMVVGRVGTAE